MNAQDWQDAYQALYQAGYGTGDWQADARRRAADVQAARQVEQERAGAVVVGPMSLREVPGQHGPLWEVRLSKEWLLLDWRHSYAEARAVADWLLRHVQDWTVQHVRTENTSGYVASTNLLSCVQTASAMSFRVRGGRKARHRAEKAR